MDEVWGDEWRRGGSDDLFAEPDAGGVILEDGSPIAARVKAGDTIPSPARAARRQATVLGFYRDQWPTPA